MLKCSECGYSYRRVVTPNDVFWRCANRSGGNSDCVIYAVREDDVCQAFVNAINKLKSSRTEILIPLIERLELMKSKVDGTELKINTIDKEIAVLSRQSLVIAELLNHGIFDLLISQRKAMNLLKGYLTCE